MKRIYKITQRALPALLFAMAALSAAEMQAQNAVFDLVWHGGEQVTGDANIQLDYKWYTDGANIDSKNKLIITSADKNISRVEFEGNYNGNHTGSVLVNQGGGTLDFLPKGTSVWQGSAKMLIFAGESNTDYNIGTLRIWYGMDSCEPPSISGAPGRFNFSHKLPDAVVHYTIAPNPGRNNGISNTGKVDLYDFLVTAKADAEGYAPSTEATKTISFATVKTQSGDVDGNSALDINDIKALILNILSRK